MVNVQSLKDMVEALVTGTGEPAVVQNPAAVAVVVVDGTPAHERIVQSAVYDSISGYFVLTVDPIE
jgi:hypothetical protein